MVVRSSLACLTLQTYRPRIFQPSIHSSSNISSYVSNGFRKIFTFKLSELGASGGKPCWRCIGYRSLTFLSGCYIPTWLTANTRRNDVSQVLLVRSNLICVFEMWCSLACGSPALCARLKIGQQSCWHWSCKQNMLLNADVFFLKRVYLILECRPWMLHFKLPVLNIMYYWVMKSVHNPVC